MGPLLIFHRKSQQGACHGWQQQASGASGCQELAHELTKIVDIEWLVDHGQDAQAGGHRVQVLITERCDENERWNPRCPCHLRKHMQTARAGHPNIGDDQIELA